MLNEEIIYHVWQFKQFSLSNFSTTDKQLLRIENAGQRNKDSGPDFFNAKILIGDTLWAGDVEIHVK